MAEVLKNDSFFPKPQFISYSSRFSKNDSIHYTFNVESLDMLLNLYKKHKLQIGQQHTLKDINCHVIKLNKKINEANFMNNKLNKTLFNENEHVDRLRQFKPLRKFSPSNIVFEDSVKLLQYHSDEELVNADGLIDTFIINNDWIIDIIVFFDELTKRNLQFKSDISIDDFLFNKEGRLKWFTSQGKLTEANQSKLRLMYLNLKQLELILQSDNLINSDLFRNNSRFRDFYNLISNEIKNRRFSYNDFAEVKDDFGKDFPSSKGKQRVGVFLDAANFLTDYDELYLDFNLVINKLFSSRYDYKIKSRYAVLFKPTFNESKKQDYADIKYFETCDNLKKNGFTIVETMNDNQKAKEIRNNEEYDVDDQKLIEIIKNNRDSFDEFIIFSGDKHYVQLYKKLKEYGKEVYFISTIEESTSKELLDLGIVMLMDDYVDCFI